MRIKSWHKKIYQLFMRQGDKQIVFIFGCQRSGTTMLRKIFDNDLRIKTYGENTILTHDRDKKHMLKSYQEVKSILDRDNASLVVIKPIAESQNVLKILTYFTNAKAVWIYRHYKDVVNSHYNYYNHKKGVDYAKNKLKGLVEGVEENDGNWFSESISNRTRNIVQKLYTEDMSSYDAAALFWYVRNILFFELKLDVHPDVYLCKYEDFVMKPDNIKNIYSFLHFPFPKKNIVRYVHSQSLGLGQHIKLNKDIAGICERLLTRLDAYRK